MGCSIMGFLIIQGALSVFVGQLQTLLGYTSSLAGVVYLSMILLAAPFVAVTHEAVKGVYLRFFPVLTSLGLSSR